MKTRLFLLIALFLAFTAYTVAIVASHGYLSFLDVYSLSAWAGQVVIDLTIALMLFLVWMVGDARRAGIPAWPYVLAILATGSIGALAYLIHRTVRESGDESMDRRSAA